MDANALLNVKLDDKYTQSSGKIYLTGTQAIVRLLMVQKKRDEQAGLHTAGFVSGYRGSPLGALDQELWRTKKHLQSHHIQFNPGLNEELAATSVWGTQMLGIDPQATVDGVFGLWYGKGPGVDRCGDVFKHGNIAGTSRHGGVLLLAGDDHSCKSSSLPHQSEHAFIAAMIPVLNPSGLAEFIEFGLHGFAMSRYSGCWVGFKSISDTIESSSSVDIDTSHITTQIPDTYPIPTDGFHIRWPDPPLEQEKRLQRERLFALLEYVRLNRLNKQLWTAHHAKLGIITTGKSYLDVREALSMLGITPDIAISLGVRLLKIGVSWPLEPQVVREFADGLDEILVVEEKRQIIEYQLKEQLYNNPVDSRPRVVGKYDETGEWVQVPSSGILLSPNGELTPAVIASVIASRLLKVFTQERLDACLTTGLTSGLTIHNECSAHAFGKAYMRSPYFCSGCPHNTSTKVPAGSKALAGIGCHYMAQWMDRSTETFSQMGGEGVTWIGQAAYTKTKHVFVNLGDGTYMHSGSLAIRAAVAAQVNITYKILVNGAVAMTGGQPVEGAPSVEQIVGQVRAEGVTHIHLVTDNPAQYSKALLPKGVQVAHRDTMEALQIELRQVPGVSVIVYEQMCAAEKRRRRKRKESVDPPARLFINPQVCEGCGDCGVQSNCLSILPLETDLGRKREIDQSACNKDMSCSKGFCPSFISVEGTYKKTQSTGVVKPASADHLPMPVQHMVAANVLVTGIGGTGVVTIGAILGMASHLEQRQVLVLDMAGLAQKGGAVSSHVRIAAPGEVVFSARIPAECVDVLIGCDVLVSGSQDALQLINPHRTQAILNTDIHPTGEFTGNPDWSVDADELIDVIAGRTLHHSTLDATAIATALLGDAVATNMLMLGVAWQKGLIPLSLRAIEQAIEINGAAVSMNKTAFLWGRHAAVDLNYVLKSAGLLKQQTIQFVKNPSLQSFDSLVKDRAQRLTDYQNTRYANRYRGVVQAIAEAEQRCVGGNELSRQVAISLYKLMAYKDEYEVARLHRSGDFMSRVKDSFEGQVKVSFHLAPPLFSKRDAKGHLVKRQFGYWMMSIFAVLSRMKFLRGTVFDVFGYTVERRAERRLIEVFIVQMQHLASTLTSERLKIAVQIARLPQQIKGYGHVKEKSLQAYETKLASLALQLK